MTIREALPRLSFATRLGICAWLTVSLAAALALMARFARGTPLAVDSVLWAATTLGLLACGIVGVWLQTSNRETGPLRQLARVSEFVSMLGPLAWCSAFAGEQPPTLVQVLFAAIFCVSLFAIISRRALAIPAGNRASDRPRALPSPRDDVMEFDDAAIPIYVTSTTQAPLTVTLPDQRDFAEPSTLREAIASSVHAGSVLTRQPDQTEASADHEAGDSTASSLEERFAVRVPTDIEASSLTTQWQSRSMDAGQETVEGGIAVTFLPGQREVSVHVAFCPPLCTIPTIETEDLDGQDWEARATAFTYGLRLDVRRSQDIQREQAGTVGYLAIAAGATPVPRGTRYRAG